MGACGSVKVVQPVVRADSPTPRARGNSTAPEHSPLSEQQGKGAGSLADASGHLTVPGSHQRGASDGKPPSPSSNSPTPNSAETPSPKDPSVASASGKASVSALNTHSASARSGLAPAGSVPVVPIPNVPPREVRISPSPRSGRTLPMSGRRGQPTLSTHVPALSTEGSADSVELVEQMESILQRKISGNGDSLAGSARKLEPTDLTRTSTATTSASNTPKSARALAVLAMNAKLTRQEAVETFAQAYLNMRTESIKREVAVARASPKSEERELAKEKGPPKLGSSSQRDEAQAET